MGLLDAMGPLTDLINLGGDIGSSIYRAWSQQKTWEREDTAVQRRAKDLEAAGLSKTLAAGSAAQTSAPINVSAPNISFANTAKMLDMAQAKKAMALTDANRDLVNANIARVDADSLPSVMFADYLRKDAQNRGSKSLDLINSMYDKLIAQNK